MYPGQLINVVVSDGNNYTIIFYLCTTGWKISNWCLWVCRQGTFSYPLLFKKTLFCYIIIKAIGMDILLISSKQTDHQSTTLWSNNSLSYMFQPIRPSSGCYLNISRKYTHQMSTSYLSYILTQRDTEV